MPSGYTAAINEGKPGYSFRDYLLTCARAFGACAHQRDEDFNVLPEPRKVDDYHERAIEKAKAELKRLKALKRNDFQIMLNDRIAETKRSKAKHEKESQELLARYNKFLKEVEAWAEPSEDHVGLKEFAIKQLNESINYDCRPSSYYDSELQNLLLLDWRSFKEQLIDSEIHSISYHEKEHKKEVEGVKKQNKWIEQLYASLPKK